ncbi:putative holin-like toxin [Paenibacillus sp. SYP-B3998]|nr:putative holin-like toxin [Paenibacillus sp. SYP-B3998]
MEVKDMMLIFIGSGTLLIAMLALVVNIIIALNNKRK